MAPRFLELPEVLEIHRYQIQRYGGSPGVRDIALLQSALAMPRAGTAREYLHADLIEMAAAYLYHIVRNHPFVDGNKRAGAVAALVFLDLNRVEVKIPDDDLVEVVVSVAEGKTPKSSIAEFLRDHAAR